MKVVWTDTAISKLKDIIVYIKERNCEAAYNLRQKLIDASKSLAKFPLSGRRGLINGTYELVTRSPYILIYVVNGSTLSIVNIIHASQQYP